MAGYHNLALFVLWLHLWLAEPWSTLPSYFLRDCLDRLLFISKCYSNRNCHCSYHFYHSIASVFYSISIRRSHWTAPDHWSLHNLEPSENDSFNWATLLEIIKVFWSSHNWATLNYISLYPHIYACHCSCTDTLAIAMPILHLLGFNKWWEVHDNWCFRNQDVKTSYRRAMKWRCIVEKKTI